MAGDITRLLEKEEKQRAKLKLIEDELARARDIQAKIQLDRETRSALRDLLVNRNAAKIDELMLKGCYDEICVIADEDGSGQIRLRRKRTPECEIPAERGGGGKRGPEINAAVARYRKECKSLGWIAKQLGIAEGGVSQHIQRWNKNHPSDQLPTKEDCERMRKGLGPGSMLPEHETPYLPEDVLKTEVSPRGEELEELELPFKICRRLKR